MATEVLLVKEGPRLAAADPISSESLEALRSGEMVTCTIRRTRNPGHHRKWFALLNLVFEAQDRYPTLEHLLDAVKIGVGHYDLVTLPGKIPLQMVKPRSISFARMDQAAFESFYDRALEHILVDVIPGVDRDDLEARVLDVVAGRR